MGNSELREGFGGDKFLPATRADTFQVWRSERASSCFNAPRHPPRLILDTIHNQQVTFKGNLFFSRYSIYVSTTGNVGSCWIRITTLPNLLHIRFCPSISFVSRSQEWSCKSQLVLLSQCVLANLRSSRSSKQQQRHRDRQWRPTALLLSPSGYADSKTFSLFHLHINN